MRPVPSRGSASSLGVALAMLIALTATRAGADEPAPEAAPAHTSGFMLGALTGYLAPIFATLGNQGPGPGGGQEVGVHAGFRWRYLYVGAAYSHGFLAGNGASGHESTSWNATGAATDYAGLDLDVIPHPDAPFAFVGHFSAGYRVLSVTSTSSYNAEPTTTTTAGPEFLLVGFGVQVNVWGWLRVQPEVSVAVGPGAFASLGIAVFFDVGTPWRSHDSRPMPPASATAAEDEPAPVAGAAVGSSRGSRTF